MAITPEQARRQLVRVGDPRAIKRLLSDELRRGAREIRKRGLAGFRSRGVGRRVFGAGEIGRQHAKGLGVSRVRDRGDHVELDVYAKGLAAIQEEGGRMAPHVIEAKNAPNLVFRVPGGLVVTKRVQHRGATHPRMPSVGPAVEKVTPEITREIERAMEGHLDRALR